MPLNVVFIHQGFEALGVEAISAAARAAGHRTSLAFDPRLFEDTYVDHPRLGRLLSFRKAAVDKALALAPDVVAIGAVSPVYRWVKAVARDLKARAPGLPVVLGGIHASAAPSYVMENEDIDFVVVGEADDAFPELLDAIERGERDFAIPNVWWRRADGEVVSTPARPFIQDLDRLSFADTGLCLAEAPYFRIGYTIQSGRGCHLRCAFCYHSFFPAIPEGGGMERAPDRYVRRRSVAHVIEELSLAKRTTRPGVVRWFDDNFAHDEPWMEEFSERYAREIGLPFWCLANPDKLTPRMVECLEHAGCYEVQIGVQSFDEGRRRGLLGRSESNEDIIRAIDLFRATKVAVATDNILNIPGQGTNELVSLARFYNRNRVGRINVYWLTLFPGTRLLDEAAARGWLTADQVESIRRDPPPVAIHVNAERADPVLRRFQTYLNLMLLLPPSWNDLILSRRLWRFFPTIDPFFLTGIAFNLRSWRTGSMFQARFFWRYALYSWRRLRLALGGRVGAADLAAVGPVPGPEPVRVPVAAPARAAAPDD